MQRLVQDPWTIHGPKSAQHIGDLAWARFQHVGRDSEWRTQLWEDGDRVVAYGWLFEDDVLEFCVHPHEPELLADVLGWAHARETSVLDSDRSAIAMLERHGYVRASDDEPFLAYLARRLDDLPPAVVPSGFELRTVAPRDVPSRVDAHRSAFDPSRVTVESYRNVMEAWPYRPELDCIVVTADGRVASYCLAWLDDVNRVGELEPVGTHADFRRRGLARAVSAFALKRLLEERAELTVVYARGDSAYTAPKLLYESLGFAQHSRTVSFRLA